MPLAKEGIKRSHNPHVVLQRGRPFGQSCQEKTKAIDESTALSAVPAGL